MQTVNLLMSYVVSSDEAVAVAGVQLLQSLVAALAPVLDAPGWTTVIHGVSIASSTDHLSAVFNPRCGFWQRSREIAIPWCGFRVPE